MPRLSSEARAMEAWRVGGTPQPAPKHLDKVSAGVWNDVVASKPVGYFDAASRVLLEVFCCASTSARAVSAKMVALDPTDPEFGRLVRLSAVLTTVLSTMAVRLRLTQSSRMRYEDGRLDERAPPKSRLLGGMASN